MKNKEVLFKQPSFIVGNKPTFYKLEHLNEFLDDTYINTPIYNPFIIRFLKGEKYYFTFFNSIIGYQENLQNIKEMNDNKRFITYEIITTRNKTKPYIDFETYMTKTEYYNTRSDIINRLINDSIIVFKNEFSHDIDKDDIKILNSSGEQPDKNYKVSFHIIIAPKNKNLLFETPKKYLYSSAYHYASSLININYGYYKGKVDEAPYTNNQQFRNINSSKKINDNRTLKAVDNTTLKELELTPKEERDYYLTYINNDIPTFILDTPIISQTIKQPIKKNITTPHATNIINDHLLNIVKKHHPSAIYKGEKDNIFNFNYTTRAEECPISGNLHHGTNGFYVIDDERGYYMGCHSSDCKGNMHIGYQKDDEFINNAEVINTKYLITNGITEEPKEPTKNYVKKWIRTDNNIMAIKSPMNTGKTTLIKGILDYHPFNRILWITHRQSLAKNIKGNFAEKYGFVCYMDDKGSMSPNKHNRVLISVDSIKRVIDKGEWGIYDLIIIDEVESVLNHFGASTMTNKKMNKSPEGIFNIIDALINESLKNKGKLLLLDADFHLRAYLFMISYGKHIFINNEYDTIKKNFIIVNDEQKYYKQIMKDLKNKINIVIVGMNTASIKHVEGLINEHNKENKYKISYIMHTSKTDDKQKKILENVNTEWIKYQCLLYSPTIDCGVDFNIVHFAKMYAILEDGYNTTSQRGFIQMIGRIRQLESQDIITLYSNNAIKNNVYIHTLQDIINYHKHTDEILNIKSKDEYKTIYSDDKSTFKRELINNNNIEKLKPYIAIQYLNEVEHYNKNRALFFTVFTRLIYSKGYTIDTNAVIKNFKIFKASLENKPSSTGLMIDNIIEILTSPDELTPFNELEYKQRHATLTENEKYMIETYKALKGVYLPKNYKLDINDKSKIANFNLLLKEYYSGLPQQIKRYDQLFYPDKELNKDNLTKDEKRELKKIIIIKDLIKHISGINDITAEKLLNHEISPMQYKKAIEGIKKTLYYKKEHESHAEFFSNSEKIKESNKPQTIMRITKTIKDLLKPYNIDMTRGNRITIGNERVFNYHLSINKNVYDIYQYKTFQSNTVDKYDMIYNRDNMKLNKTIDNILIDIDNSMMTGKNPFKKQSIEQPIKQPIKQHNKKVNIMDI